MGKLYSDPVLLGQKIDNFWLMYRLQIRAAKQLSVHVAQQNVYLHENYFGLGHKRKSYHNKRIAILCRSSIVQY